MLPVEFDASHQQRLPSRAKAIGGFGYSLLELARIGARSRKFSVPLAKRLRNRDLQIDAVPMNLQVTGTHLRHDSRNHVVNLLGREFRLLDDLCGACQFGEDPALGLHVLHLVMDLRDLLLGVSRPPRDDEQGNLLGVGARDGVHHVVSPRTVGHAHDSKPSCAAGVAVCRKAHGRLVGEADDLEAARRSEPVVETEGKIPRQAENVGYPGAL